MHEIVAVFYFESSFFRLPPHFVPFIPFTSSTMIHFLLHVRFAYIIHIYTWRTFFFRGHFGVSCLLIPRGFSSSRLVLVCKHVSFAIHVGVPRGLGVFVSRRIASDASFYISEFGMADGK